MVNDTANGVGKKNLLRRRQRKKRVLEGALGTQSGFFPVSLTWIAVGNQDKFLEFNMEDFVAAVKVFSQDKNWKELKEYINESAGLIAKNASKIDSAISALDPFDHSLGYLGLV